MPYSSTRRCATTPIGRGSTTSPCRSWAWPTSPPTRHRQGFNVGVLDAEAHGLGFDRASKRSVNAARAALGRVQPARPHLRDSAPTSRRGLTRDITVMARRPPSQGHAAPRSSPTPGWPPARRWSSAKANCASPRSSTTTAAAAELPGVMWRDPLLGTPARASRREHAAPARARHQRACPSVDRRYLAARPLPGRAGRTRGQHGRRPRLPLRLLVLRRRGVAPTPTSPSAPATPKHHRRDGPAARRVRRDRVPVRRRPVPRRTPLHRHA